MNAGLRLPGRSPPGHRIRITLALAFFFTLLLFGSCLWHRVFPFRFQSHLGRSRLLPSIFVCSHASTPRNAGTVGGCAKALTVTLKGIRPTRPAFFASPSEANANRRTSGEMEMKTKSKKENHMEPTKKNLKKSQARVEAPHQSVQSAKWVADQIGGIPEYQAKVANQILKVCAAFGGRIVGVTL